MKIAIGHRIVDGPWGGGNSFVRNLANELISRGVEVFFDLSEPDLDFILLTDPRSSSSNVAFSAKKILSYTKKYKHAIVIHRINECDERKRTHFMNLRLRIANYVADHTVFVGSWLKSLPLTHSLNGENFSVILNGADRRIFNQFNHHKWGGEFPIRLVTHHWGGNWMKGFDVYSKLDQMLNSKKWQGKIDFTYIGNLPKRFKFENARYIYPLSGHQLADELRRHDAYVTGSINEPGGNHQIEGGLCGLPILYINSGCMPEYCNGFGISFELDNFEEKLEELINNYELYFKAMATFPYSIERTVNEWLVLFENLQGRREKILEKRRDKKSLIYELLNHVVY